MKYRLEGHDSPHRSAQVFEVTNILFKKQKPGFALKPGFFFTYGLTQQLVGGPQAVAHKEER